MQALSQQTPLTQLPLTQSPPEAQLVPKLPPAPPLPDELLDEAMPDELLDELLDEIPDELLDAASLEELLEEELPVPPAPAVPPDELDEVLDETVKSGAHEEIARETDKTRKARRVELSDIEIRYAGCSTIGRKILPADADNAIRRATGIRGMLQVLWRDSNYVAVDKPSGIAVHRGMCPDKVTALELTRDMVRQWVFPVHRLDRATSGVLLFALSSESAGALHEKFENGGVEKRYWALVRGIAPLEGTIDHAIPRCEGGPRVEALTTFRRLWSGAHVSLVEAYPRTGRFHQVRRHLKHIHHPLIGDANYGKGALNRAYRDEFGLNRLALHAAGLAFDHPLTGERILLESVLPDDLRIPFERIGVIS